MRARHCKVQRKRHSLPSEELPLLATAARAVWRGFCSLALVFTMRLVRMLLPMRLVFRCVLVLLPMRLVF